MSRPKHHWQDLFDAFDPWKPARGAVRADRGPWSPMDRLSRELSRGLGRKRLLLLGTQGSGKTTEILRLAEQRADDFFVVYLDVWRHLQEGVRDAPALERLQPWEVLLLVGLAVYRAGKEELHLRWPREIEAAFGDAIVALHASAGRQIPPVELAKLAEGMLVTASSGRPRLAVSGPPLSAPPVTLAAERYELAEGASALRELPALANWALPLGASGARPIDDQDPAVRNLRDAVNKLLATVQTSYKSVLLLVDGLDRIVQAENVQRLFIDASVLAELEATTVVAASLTLRRPGLGGRVRGWEVRVMYCVPVLDHAQPWNSTQRGPGVVFFRDLVARRHPLAAEMIPVPVIDRFSWASGGLVRDFLKLVQVALGEAFDRNVDVVDEESAGAAIDDQRRALEGVALLYVDDLQVLSEVSHTLQLPHGDRIGSLVDGFCVLPYPNETEWWYPHPLLTLVKLRGRIGSGA